MISIHKRAAAGDEAVISDGDANADIELGIAADEDAVTNLDRGAWFPKTVIFEKDASLDDALLAE
jgi:hypothetical protein